MLNSRPCGALIGALMLASCGSQPADSPKNARNDLGRATFSRIFYPMDHPATLAVPGGENFKIRSLLNVNMPMRYGSFIWNDAGVPPGKTWIRIDLRTQLLSVFRGGDEIGTVVILYGADGNPTPTGRFRVLAMMRDHRSSLYDAPMPYTLRLTDDGVSIHGSNVRYGAATHGCIGVPTEFASHIFAQISVADEVIIV